MVASGRVQTLSRRGVPDRRIAIHYKITIAEVRALKRKPVSATTRKRIRKLPGHSIAEAARRHLAGETVRELSLAFKVTKPAICFWLGIMGVKPLREWECAAIVRRRQAA